LLCLGAALGLPIGALLLGRLPDAVMKRVLGVVILALALLLLIGRRWRVRREHAATLGVATVAGVLGGMSGVSGPPVVLLGLNQEWEAAAFRADLNAFFLWMSLCSAPLYALFGMLTWESAQLALWMAPGAIVGYGLGGWLQPRTSPRLFRAITFVAIFIAGLLPLVLPA